MRQFDDIVYARRYQPYYGWHDDHRGHDRTAAYMPAIQQSKSEFCELAGLLADRGLGGKCIQLGLGLPGASHEVLKTMFKDVYTVEIDLNTIHQFEERVGCDQSVITGNSHDPILVKMLESIGYNDLDFLFVDGDHSAAGVAADYHTYSKLVRPGGIVAMHDALKRSTYEEEIQVWRFVDTLREQGTQVNMIGTELGIAWVVKK